MSTKVRTKNRMTKFEEFSRHNRDKELPRIRSIILQ